MFRLDGVNVPRWFDITYLPNNVVSTISAFGNPVVWWIGFALMLVLTERAIHGRGISCESLESNLKVICKQTHQHKRQGWDLPAIFIVVVFFFTWLPYVFIGRATYIYHFYLSVPLLCLATTYFINKYWNTRNRKNCCHSHICRCSGNVCAVLPSNFWCTRSTSNTYIILKWFPSWYFAP